MSRHSHEDKPPGVSHQCTVCQSRKRTRAHEAGRTTRSTFAAPHHRSGRSYSWRPRSVDERNVRAPRTRHTPDNSGVRNDERVAKNATGFMRRICATPSAQQRSGRRAVLRVAGRSSIITATNFMLVLSSIIMPQTAMLCPFATLSKSTSAGSHSRTVP